MAELTDIRESVRQRYAAAAKRAATEDPAHGTAGCCGGSGASSSPADATGVFGADLYDAGTAAEAPKKPASQP